MQCKPALLGASLGWIAAAGWSAPHWFAVVASVMAVVYLLTGLRQKGECCMMTQNERAVKAWMDTHRTQIVWRKVARMCIRLGLRWMAPVIWRRQRGTCIQCGRLCGFDSVISRHGFLCTTCHCEVKAR